MLLLLHDMGAPTGEANRRTAVWTVRVEYPSEVCHGGIKSRFGRSRTLQHDVVNSRRDLIPAAILAHSHNRAAWPWMITERASPCFSTR